MRSSPATTRSGVAATNFGRNQQRRNLVQMRTPKENCPPGNVDATLQFFQKTLEQRRQMKKRPSKPFDDEWIPPKRQKKTICSRFSSRSIGSQTPAFLYKDCKPISHSDMLNLQLDGNFSDKQMRIFARFLRKKTVSNIIVPQYEAALSKQHHMFVDLYDSRTYTPPTDGADPIPLTICNDTKALLERVERAHDRKVRLVKHGVDSGA